MINIYYISSLPTCISNYMGIYFQFVDTLTCHMINILFLLVKRGCYWYYKAPQVTPSPFCLENIHQIDCMNMSKTLDHFFLKVPKAPMKLKDVRILKITRRCKNLLIGHSFCRLWVNNQIAFPNELNFTQLYRNSLPLNPDKLKYVLLAI